ncbi:glycohydrolase toxin TNT-related protein [Pseudomonas botevensis]|uniref:glycohydrolase toxin TNT-related protein n=1 Tax=Pseudomonas botevensis TaxID=2842352 RepID=UPI001C3C7B78|nr:glycohydrolase toxin TNT-related protein [Pseudomonas botevensis]MBV4476871.1 glycohydrolase toxin TNT-related protein [Pseudomonas botevensis]
MEGYALAGFTAGIGNTLPYNPEEFSVDTLEKAGVTSVADATAKTVLEGGSLKDNLVGSLAGAAINVGGATLANDIGGTTLPDGSLTKIGLHALLGGVLSVAQGGDFRTGALAAGADEAAVTTLSDWIMPDPSTADALTTQEGQQRLLAASGLIGVLAATATGGDPSIAASVAQNATQHNFLGANSQQKRDDARTAMEEGDRSPQTESVVRTTEQTDQRSDGLLDKYLADPDSLTPEEKTRFDGYLGTYYTEQAAQYGPEQALSLVGDLLANGNPDKTYDFPYAGTAEQRTAAADAQEDAAGGLLPLLLNPRQKSGNEELYNLTTQNQLITEEQQGLSNIGTPALYALPGSLGLGIAAIGLENSVGQIGYGVWQASTGDYTDAAGNIILGGLGTAGAWGVREGGLGAAGGVEDAAVVGGVKVTPPETQASTGAIADNEAGGFSYYDQFKKADGSWDWPKELGFSGNSVKNTLPVGTKLDRYGGPEGYFLSPQGVPFDQRALAPGSRAGGYYQYEVLKPLPVVQGEIAPAFGQPGGGTQILPDLSERFNVDRLVKEGYLRRTN